MAKVIIEFQDHNIHSAREEALHFLQATYDLKWNPSKDEWDQREASLYVGSLLLYDSVKDIRIEE